MMVKLFFDTHKAAPKNLQSGVPMHATTGKDFIEQLYLISLGTKSLCKHIWVMAKLCPLNHFYTLRSFVDSRFIQLKCRLNTSKCFTCSAKAGFSNFSHCNVFLRLPHNDTSTRTHTHKTTHPHTHLEGRRCETELLQVKLNTPLQSRKKTSLVSQENHFCSLLKGCFEDYLK